MEFQAVSCSLVLFVIFLAPSKGQDLQFGMNHFPAGETYFSCGNVSFKSPFQSSDVHIHTTLFNKDPNGNTYEAAVSWVEDVTLIGFKACAVTAGPYRDMKTLIVNWMAFEQTPQGSQSGRHTLRSFVSGSTCEKVFFPSSFGGKPDVYATAVHRGHKEDYRDAATIWVEDVRPISFKICLREMKNFNGEHAAIEVDWMAMLVKPGNWKAKEKKMMKMLNEGSPPRKRKYSFCMNSTFDYKFYEPPVIITCASHTFDPGNPRSISPATNTLSNWVENLDVNGFEVCMKDGQKLRGRHTPLDIQFLALGDLDPCLDVICSFYGQCVAFGPTDARCVCDYPCPTYENMLCSAAGITYDNECLYKREMCKNKQNIPIAHAGSCRPFILQRGRAQLLLDIIDVQCVEVTYNGSLWYTSLPVHVLATVNHDTVDTSVVHDAITNWVEKISHSKFTVCALKAGRNEYEGTIPTNFGKTYIDWIAFQGSPKGGVVGEEVMSDWWEGTTCKALSLPADKFLSSPSVLLTAEHTRIGLKHDAATLWTEDVTSSTFKVCMRELQDFDGIHKNINVNWMAFEDLPRNLFSERRSLYFENNQLPLDSNRHAYCKSVEFLTAYRNIPTVLISATHNSTVPGALPPKHNSIASWIEDISHLGFRVCIKELNDEGTYDPIKIFWVALPECSLPLGVSDPSVIPDSALTASSQLSSNTAPKFGRLTSDYMTYPVSWCAASNVDQWLQVDLGHLHVVSGVATQGSYDQRAWVTAYQLSYSKDNIAFTTYKENGLNRTFQGNSDSRHDVRRTFQDPVEMRLLRFIPTGFTVSVCTRVEIYGCDTEPIHVRILSEGCEDSLTRCGFSSIEVDGIEGSLQKRGHNVVALNQEGTFLQKTSFDTYGDLQAGAKLDAFIKALPTNTIVLIAVQDTGDSFIGDAEDALRSIYAETPVLPSYRGSWALIGFKGSPRPSWVRQVSNEKGLGPSVISATIPLYGK